MQQIYDFEIEGQRIGVNSEDGQFYHVSVDGNYVGKIYPKFEDDLSDGGLSWKSDDKISNRFVQLIGKRIEGEDF